MSDPTPPTLTKRQDAEAVAPTRHDTGELPVTKTEMRKSFRINELYTFVVASMTAIAAVFGAYKLLLNEAEAAGERGAMQVEPRVATLERQQGHTNDDVHELQMDVRALYKAVMTGRPQERLENPPQSKDGGQ